ncbi:MAG TPA: ABC transporter permease [Actinocrinis sp.]|jgi:ABC-2 type transport system permease protein
MSSGTAQRQGKLPSMLDLGISRIGMELTIYRRVPEQVVFGFAYPLIMLAIFGSVFPGTIPHTDVRYQQYYAASLTATGMMTVGFQSVAIGIALDRDNNIIKRLRGMPMPPMAYFVGKIGSVLVQGVAQTALMIAVAALFFHLHVPSDPWHWFTLVWVFLLGLATCAVLGVAVGGVLRNGRSASAVVVTPLIVLQFISGVFFPVTQLPRFLLDIGAVFPLKWLCQGIRSAFLPDDFKTLEPAGSWEHPMTLIVLAAWLIGALALSVRTFGWRGQDEH